MARFGDSATRAYLLPCIVRPVEARREHAGRHVGEARGRRAAHGRHGRQALDEARARAAALAAPRQVGAHGVHKGRGLDGCARPEEDDCCAAPAAPVVSEAAPGGGERAKGAHGTRCSAGRW